MGVIVTSTVVPELCSRMKHLVRKSLSGESMVCIDSDSSRRHYMKMIDILSSEVEIAFLISIDVIRDYTHNKKGPAFNHAHVSADCVPSAELGRAAIVLQ